MCILNKPLFALTRANPLGPYKNLYIIKCMDGFYQTQVFTVSRILKNSFSHKADFSAERSLCCSHHALAGGNSPIAKNRLSLIAPLARAVLSGAIFTFRAGPIASHQSDTSGVPLNAMNAAPKGSAEPSAGEGKEKRKNQQLCASCSPRHTHGIVTGTKTKPISFFRYKFGEVWFSC